MSFVIGVTNLKGGCGKTTLSVNLADGLARRGFRVMLGDLDEGQDSSLSWFSLNESPKISCKGINPMLMDGFFNRHTDDYDFIIVDGPPRANGPTGALIRHSSLCLLPVAPSPLELWALKPTVDLIKQRQLLTGGIPLVRAVLSRCKANTKLIPKSVRVLNDLGLEILTHGTMELEAYKQSFEYGESVYMESNEISNLSNAKKQMELIVDEILHLSEVNHENS